MDELRSRSLKEEQGAAIVTPLLTAGGCSHAQAGARTHETTSTFMPSDGANLFS